MPFYITTTIPYVNAKPHIGFALELVQADCLARYHRQRGASVYLRTGTDENASKNVDAASNHGVDPKTWVEQHSAQFRRLADKLGIQFDDFIRTTEPRHQRKVNEILSQLNPRDLERRSYSSLYCRGCEDFRTERDLIDGLCPEHRAVPELVEEENIFFLLSRYQQQLEELIGSGAIRIQPEQRKNEILAFIRSGLQDISISRSAERVGHWGIPFPGTQDQVVYVWIDALINYLVPGAPDELWTAGNRKIHLLGKNVWKFHAIYWPALLLSSGLPLPDELLIHGFVTIDGKKISKSGGPQVDPIECLEKYGAETLRFYLLHEIPPYGDGDFSIARLEATYTHYLVNGLGNLTHRLLRLAELSELQNLALIPEPDEKAGEYLAQGDFARYLDVVWAQVDELNREIEQARPWEWIKSGNHSVAREKCANWLHRLHRLAVTLEPALPETSARIATKLSAVSLTPSQPLFPRLAPSA